MSRTSDRLREKIRNWITQNIGYTEVDVDTEIDSSLNFNENLKLLREKFPGLFSKSHIDEPPKQLIMPGWLIEKIHHGEKYATFRPRALQQGGLYYLVPSRFQGRDRAKLVIKILEVEDAPRLKSLSDEDCLWTGLENKAELFHWFEKWYGNNPKYKPKGLGALKFRNWFIIDDDVYYAAI